MYGLVDAPVLWSIALRYFIISDMHGQPSRYDENFFYWIDKNSKSQPLVAICTIHVDDLVLASNKKWMAETYDLFLKKFGNVKRQFLPFTNIGMEYSRTKLGGIKLTQVEYANGLKAVALSDNKSQPNKVLTPSDVTTLRGGIGSVLFLCLTRWDLLYDLVVLQTKVKDAVQEQPIECNRIIMAAKKAR